jgi:hypothetical protein
VKQQHALAGDDEDGTLLGKFFAGVLAEHCLVVELKATRAEFAEGNILTPRGPWQSKAMPEVAAMVRGLEACLARKAAGPVPGAEET